jgi:H+-transporting ATPase
MAIGASTMAEKKAIVTHLTALQEIASMKVLCSDKTGTLTTANMTIIAEKIWTAEGFTQVRTREAFLPTSRRACTSIPGANRLNRTHR